MRGSRGRRSADAMIEVLSDQNVRYSAPLTVNGYVRSLLKLFPNINFTIFIQKIVCSNDRYW